MKAVRSISLAVACSLVPAATVFSQTKENYCEPLAALKDELKKLPKFNEDESNYKQYQERRMAALGDLAKKYPDDFHVRKRWAMMRVNDEKADRAAIIAEYRARMEKRPNDPAAAYLYAHLLVGRNTKESIETLNKVARQSPDFPWAYVELGRIYTYPAFRDQAKSRENLKQWATKCPAALDDVYLFSRSGDQELMRDALRRLRAHLATSDDPSDLRYYSDAWALEFKLKPVPEHPQVRKQIAEEVKQLREKNLGSKEWLQALQEGYKNAGDKEGKRWAEDEMLRLHPKSSAARRMARQRWDEEHPRPNPNETEKMKVFNQALVKATDEWLKQWPDDVGFWGARYFAMQDQEDVSNAEIEAAAEGFLKAMEKNEGSIFYIPPVQTLVAGAYARRNIATDRIPALVMKGLEKMEPREKPDDVNDLYPRESGFVPGSNLKYVRWQSWPLLAEAYAKLKQPEKAREALAQMAEALKKEKPDEKAKQSEKTDYLYHQVSYWQAVAKVAEAESRKLDGLTAYQTALSFRPKSYKPMPGRKDELAGSAESLWKELGGTDEGWKAHLARNEASKGAIEAAEAGGWDARSAALPDFALTDLAGRKWQLADLKGKVAFINFWATWCGPCLMELPYVQKLHEQMKDNKDILILTFNTDDELGLVEPFMAEKKYSFTVIPAHEYAQGQNVYSIPRNWVVGADGVLQFESIGFGNDGDEWMKKAIETIQKVKEKK